MPHSSLRSFVSKLMLALLTLGLAAQAPTTNAPATTSTPTSNPTDDPFAVLAAKEPQPPERAGVRIVVQRPDGSPAKDAVVVFTPWRDGAWADDERAKANRQFPTDEPKRLAAEAASGTRYRVDERGASRVPRHGLVLAFAGELAVRRFVAANAPESRLVLTLAPPRPVTLEIVTATGEPAAAVPLTILDPELLIPVRSGQSGPEGLATFHLLDHRPASAVVQLEVAATAAVEAPLPASDERPRLVLPPTTAVEATFAGDLTPGNTLQWALRAGDAGPWIVGDSTGERSVRWPFVERGATCKVMVQSGGYRLATVTMAATETTGRVTVVRNLADATFAVQILAPSGEPARDRSVRLHWETEPLDEDRFAYGGRTNREGWLEISMPDRYLGKPGVALKVELLESRDGSPLGCGKVALAASGKGFFELPPLRCEPQQVLAAGTFVTRDDQPVARLSLTVLDPSHQRLVTSDAGEFVVRGAIPERAVQVLLDRSWCAVDGHPWQIGLPVGTQDARLVVQRAARLRLGTDLGGHLHTKLGWRLEPADGDGEAIELPFSLEPGELLVPPGHWHMVVNHEQQELHRLPDLRCESGVETHDPRFLAFDWRAFAILVEVRVRDPKGRAIDTCTVWLPARGTNPTKGVLRLLLPKDGTEVEIDPNFGGLPRVRLGVVTTDQDVVLGGGPALTVRLQPLPQLPEHVQLVLSLGDGPGVPFEADGTATVLTPKAGTFVPSIGLRHQGREFGALPWQLPAVEVATAGTTFVVELNQGRKVILDGFVEQAQRF